MVGRVVHHYNATSRNVRKRLILEPLLKNSCIHVSVVVTIVVHRSEEEKGSVYESSLQSGMYNDESLTLERDRERIRLTYYRFVDTT